MNFKKCLSILLIWTKYIDGRLLPKTNQNTFNILEEKLGYADNLRKPDETIVRSFIPYKDSDVLEFKLNAEDLKREIFLAAELHMPLKRGRGDPRITIELIDWSYDNVTLEKISVNVEKNGWFSVDVSNSLRIVLSKQPELPKILLKFPENYSFYLEDSPFLVVFSEVDKERYGTDVLERMNLTRVKRSSEIEVVLKSGSKLRKGKKGRRIYRRKYSEMDKENLIEKNYERFRYTPVKTKTETQPKEKHRGRRISNGRRKDMNKKRRRRRRKNKRKNGRKKAQKRISYDDGFPLVLNASLLENYPDDDALENEKLPLSWILPNQRTKSPSKKDKCKVMSHTLDLSDLGWEKWIISPQKIPFTYCEGSCSLDYFGPTWSNHAAMKVLIRRLGLQKNISEISESSVTSSCVPTSTDSHTLLFWDENGNTVLKTFPDMIVKECGCR